MFSAIPFLIIPVAFYALVTIVNPVPLADILFSLALPSDIVWRLDLGNALVALAGVMLFIEVLKATRTGSVSIIDHGLSTLLFVACLLAFLLVPAFGTTPFALITLLTLIDAMAGYSVTLRAARRDLAVGPGSTI